MKFHENLVVVVVVVVVVVEFLRAELNGSLFQISFQHFPKIDFFQSFLCLSSSHTHTHTNTNTGYFCS